MKRLVLTLALAATTCGTFAQGYFVFAAGKNNVYEDFKTPLTSVKATTEVNVGFIWGPAATVLPALGAGGTSTASGQSIAGSPWAVLGALPGGWNWAVDATSANSGKQVVANVGASSSWSYNGGSSVGITGTAAGTTYTVYAIGWDATYGTPAAAIAAGGSPIGWAAPIQYGATGSSGTPLTFSATAGWVTGFGVQPVPEPSTFALAGLGAAALLIFRRRK